MQVRHRTAGEDTDKHTTKIYHTLSEALLLTCGPQYDVDRTPRYVFSLWLLLALHKSNHAYAKASRRSRDRQNEELRELVEKCNEQSEHINELEERIEALVRMLEEAGISLPSDINDTLCDNLGNDIDSNAEQIFDELTHILDGDKVDDDHEEEQEGEEEYEYEYER